VRRIASLFLALALVLVFVLDLFAPSEANAIHQQIVLNAGATPTPTATPSCGPTSNTFTYVSDGDTNGVLYFIGRNLGTTTWTNPFPASGMSGNVITSPFGTAIKESFSGYLAGQTDPFGIADRAASHVHINATGHWVKYDFGPTGCLVVTKWNLQNRDNFDDGATNVICEGSNDNTSWTSLNQNSSRSATRNVWAGGTVSDTTGWRYVRIRKVVDTDYFTIGEIELYGTLNY
jgi:hypothetical protein